MFIFKVFVKYKLVFFYCINFFNCKFGEGNVYCIICIMEIEILC